MTLDLLRKRAEELFRKTAGGNDPFSDLDWLVVDDFEAALKEVREQTIKECAEIAGNTKGRIEFLMSGARGAILTLLSREPKENV